jgi:hypothetical protein
MTAAPLDISTSISIMDPHYETLLLTLTDQFKFIDKALELIGCQFKTFRNGLDTAKNQFQTMTRWITKDIGALREEITHINADVRRFGQDVDNGVNAWNANENFMPEYGYYIAQTNSNLATHPTTETVCEMIAASIPPHVHATRLMYASVMEPPWTYKFKMPVYTPACLTYAFMMESP